MTLSATAVFIPTIGCLGLILLHAFWLTSITAYAQKIPEDCSVCGIGLKNDGKKSRGMSPPGNATSYPWIVSIGWDYYTHNCFGTLIDAFHILTAAHCVIDSSGDLAYYDKVFFRSQPGIGINGGLAIDKIIAHPLYGLEDSPTAEIIFAKYDIALVKLKQRIKCGEYRNPICLPYADSKLPLDARIIFTGWGFTDPVTRRRTELLRHGYVKNLNFSECLREVPESSIIKNHMSCQGGTQHRMCYGDSGSPLMNNINQKYYIVGIASSETNSDCALNKPMIFTDVVKFLNWIQKEKTPTRRLQSPRWRRRWINFGNF